MEGRYGADELNKFFKLKENGFDVPTDVYTVSEGAKRLTEFLERGKANG